jgi:hypothetical protein
MRRFTFLLSLAALVAALPAVRSAGDDEAPAGYQSLFNGKDLTGWVICEGGKIDRWGAEDGILYTTGKEGGGWLMTEKEYGDFDLLLEYKVPKAGNSGVAVHSSLKGRPSEDAIEIQILDNPWYLDEKNYKGLQPVQLTAAIYGVVPPSKDATKPAGEWNKMHIKSKGRHLTVRVNGTVVTDADLDDYKDHADKHPGLLRTRGHLGLQCHTDRVEFRHIYVKAPAE